MKKSATKIGKQSIKKILDHKLHTISKGLENIFEKFLFPNCFLIKQKFHKICIPLLHHEIS